MPFPKGGQHKPETCEKIRESVQRFHERKRRDTLVRTGVGRTRAPIPTRERGTFTPQPCEQEE